jgi:hypothetical protein
MKTQFIKLLLDAKGRINSLAVGAVVGGVTKFLADRNWTLDPTVEDLLSATVALTVMWAIDSLVLKLQADGVKQIQDALPPHVKSDGVPGDVTVAAVKRAASDAT